jgi:hypothetical protein
MKLYELKAEYEELLTRYRDAETDEEIAEVTAALQALEGSLSDKLDSCARVYRTLCAEAEVYDAEARRLRERAKIIGARAERLKEYIGNCLGHENKAKTALFSFSWRRSKAVSIIDESLIPDGYMREKVIAEPDKIEMKKDLECGATIPGVALVENYNLQIK